MGTRTSVYLDDDLKAAVKASDVPLAEVIRRGLAAGTAAAAQPPAQSPASTSLAALPDGEPGNGAVCMTPTCWQRDTRKYGLRSLPLCTACAAALQGQTYRRDTPPGAARAIRRCAA